MDSIESIVVGEACYPTSAVVFGRGSIGMMG